MAMITTDNTRYIFVAITVGCLPVMVLQQSLAPVYFIIGRPVEFLVKRKPVCSVDVIRKYCLEHNYFPTGGTRLNSSYFPDRCRFPSNGMNKERIRECLTRRNVTKIVVLGDSNGLRYFRATKKLLEKFLKCRTVKKGRGMTMPDVSYFTKGTKLKASDIVVHHRDCGGCRSNAKSCSDNSTKINVEYISMEFYLDTEVTTVRNKWQKNCHPSKEASYCRQSNTNQEFILGENLEGNYPDVLLLFSGNHDKARAGLTKIRGDMEYLKMLFKKYVPKQTKVFWFSKITENPKRKSKRWRDPTFDGKLKTNPFLERLNYELFDVLRTEFKETGGKILPFFDMTTCHSMSWTGRLTGCIDRSNGMTPSYPTGYRHFVKHKTSFQIAYIRVQKTNDNDYRYCRSILILTIELYSL